MGWKYDFLLDVYPNRLQEVRTGKQYTKVKLQKESGVSNTTILRIERLGQGSEWKPAATVYWKDRRRIPNTVAEALSATLGAKPQEIFENYEKARLEAAKRVKLFSNIAERNAAIEEVLPEVQKYVKKNAHFYRNALDFGDLEDIALQTLINVADRAMTRGLPTKENFNFVAYVIRAVGCEWKNAIKRKKKEKVHFEGMVDENGNQKEIVHPQLQKAIRYGNIEDTPLDKLVHRQECRELVNELKKMKELIDRFEAGQL